MISSRMLLISSLLLAMCVALPSGDFRERRQIVSPTEEGGMEPEVSCETPDRAPGQCVSISDCPNLCYKNFDRLYDYKCGLRDKEFRVCCPRSPEDVSPIRTCTTTEGVKGHCVLYSSCPSLCKVNYNILSHYNCGVRIEGDPRVCCPSNKTRNDEFFGGTPYSWDEVIRPVRSVYLKNRPSFLPKDCGITSTTTPRIAGGRLSAPGAWPWIAAIFIRRKHFKSTNCAGSLITSNYVITAADCIHNKWGVSILPNYISVRLGDYDLYDDNDGMNPIEIRVERTSVHGLYGTLHKQNNIAILRLAEHVTFSKYIAPICLPYDSLYGQILTSRRAFVAGWGSMEFWGPKSSPLREVSFPIMDPDDCWKAYVCLVPISAQFICAGRLNGSAYASLGDAGGPLMMVGKENRFYLIGIVSLPNELLLSGFPGLYTRVTEYREWMHGSMLQLNKLDEQVEGEGGRVPLIQSGERNYLPTDQTSSGIPPSSV